jgi:hypothetical protein
MEQFLGKAKRLRASLRRSEKLFVHNQGRKGKEGSR